MKNFLTIFVFFTSVLFDSLLQEFAEIEVGHFPFEKFFPVVEIIMKTLPLDVQDFDGLTRLYVRTWRAGNVHLAWPFFANNLPRRPADVLLHNSAAWLLATTENPPAPPAEAVRLAQLALAAAGEDHPSLLDTLAAAQAAAGDFEAARQTIRDAFAHLESTGPGDSVVRNKLAARLDFYRQGKPWRE